jgi:hypothetical protein
MLGDWPRGASGDEVAPGVPGVPGEVHEVVALDRNGELLWRHAAETLVAVTGSGVVIQTSDRWELLSTDDGVVVSRDPLAESERPPASIAAAATDGHRLYSLTEEGVLVRNLTDLSARTVSVRGPRGGGLLSTASLHATDGRLIVQTSDGLLDAFEDADAP